ncbi:MAG: hypothetical protein K0R14_1403 [Burkholderiales bacterium]|jgi:hypothetical protein|nr:hypothetical protein [Burkholderiales bacterium]
MNKIKKVSYLCGLLGLSLYSNVAYAKGYNGDINFRCSFKIYAKQLDGFRAFVQHFELNKTKTADNGIVKSGDEYNFVFWGAYKSNQEVLIYDFIDAINKKINKEIREKTNDYKIEVEDVEADIDEDIVRHFSFKDSRIPIFSSKLKSSSTNMLIKIDVNDSEKSKGNNHELGTTLTYEGGDVTGRLEGTCNFVGHPYSRSDSDKENQDTAVVVHTK